MKKTEEYGIILTTYQKEIKVDEYVDKIKELLNKLKKEYGYSNLNALLVLKDILPHVWNSKEEDYKYEKTSIFSKK